MFTAKAILLESRKNASYDPKFNTKAGWLNDYALSCGYIQLFDRHGHRVILEKVGNGAYTVFSTVRNKYHGFTTYTTLIGARKIFLIAARIVANY